MANRKIKLIAVDLDGTLLRQDHITLSPKNREALTRAADEGIEVAVATGRSIAAIAPQVLELPFLRYFITCNGKIRRDIKPFLILLCLPRDFNLPGSPARNKNMDGLPFLHLVAAIDITVESER